ncbi:MAG: NRDE family protein [Planctomycetota bacterium]
MCTVTVIPWQPNSAKQTPSTGFRLACNRDESRNRPLALPPQTRNYGSRRAILPIDPISDGTWIAVNDRGLVMTLLNVYEQQPGLGHAVRNPNWRSRGVIIPELLGADSALDAAKACGRLIAIEFPPFRLIIVDRSSIVEARSNGTELSFAQQPLRTNPVMFTSSGIGDQIVDGPRRKLFEEMFFDTVDFGATQDAFHRHSWPDRTHLSVCMSRPEAMTVSNTVVEVSSDRVRLRYVGAAPDQPVEKELTLVS